MHVPGRAIALRQRPQRGLRRPHERPGQLRRVRQGLRGGHGLPNGPNGGGLHVPGRPKRKTMRQRRRANVRRDGERSQQLRLVRHRVRDGRELSSERLRVSDGPNAVRERHERRMQ
jgi:hypothetical protein